MSFIEKLSQIDSAPIIDKHIPSSRFFLFDFSEANEELKNLDMNNQREFESYIDRKIENSNSEFGIGKYAENRILYQRFNLFDTGDPRSFHLGIDIWQDAGTEIFSPLEGVIHSFQDNNTIGDYGPTIILEHSIEGYNFFTLYGHLSRESLCDKEIGMKIAKGQKLCNLGDWEVNVHWPPHLHFQIIKDLKGMKGDFPGVCEYIEKESWMENCPDPNLILNLPGL